MSRPIHRDPFSETLTDIPTLVINSTAVWDGFIFNNSLESSFLRLRQSDDKALPDLLPQVLSLDLNNVPLPYLSISPSSPSASSHNEFFEVQEALSDEEEGGEEEVDDENTDIWALPEVFQKPRTNRLICWDNFLNKKHEEPQSGYLSEVNARVFTLIVNRPATNSSRIIKSDVLLNAAFELNMGRSSGLFQWDTGNNVFRTRWEDIVAIGYSGTLLRNTIATFTIVGGETKKLVGLCRDLDTRSQRMLPSRIALLSAARCALFTIHKHLEDKRREVSSLLQLSHIVDKVKTLVQVLNTCCNATKTSRSEQEAILYLMKEASAAAVAHSGLDAILQEIFTQVTQPTLEKLSCAIGLPSTSLNGNSPELAEEGEDYSWLGLLSAETSLLISQTRQSLQLLRQCTPQAPIVQGGRRTGGSTLTFNLVYAHTATCRQQNFAFEYENTMRSAIVASEPAGLTARNELSLTGRPLESKDISTPLTNGPFHLDLDLFSLPTPGEERRQETQLNHEVDIYLKASSTEDPAPLQLQFDQVLASSVAPVIAAQHRLLGYSVLRMLFEKHDLIAHIKIQRDFHLFGHPTFSQRLSTALFDPNQSSGARNRLTGASTGLRLQNRDTWPPAGSELRLVLMGILSDSFASSKESAFENNISFAIRDMPPEDLEKCREVDSIHALHFLRLQYKAPNHILETVLSTSILDKYDRVFQHLLLILRLHSVTQSLLRANCRTRGTRGKDLSDQKLILEMHHFTTSLADYCQNTAMILCWRPFDELLRNAKAHIDAKDYDTTLQLVRSQDFLKTLHEQTLDDILQAMLLRNKQARGLHLLHDLFNLILQFAALKRTQAEAGVMQRRVNDNDDTTMKRYEHDFQKHMVGLMEFLRSESKAQAEQKGARVQAGIGRSDGKADDPIEHLLLRLDMFGYWSTKGRKKELFIRRL